MILATAHVPSSRPPVTESRFSHRFDTLQQLARDILVYAEKQGASACEVDVSDGFGQSVTVRCGEVETIEYNRDKSIAVTVYLGQRKGQASTSIFLDGLARNRERGLEHQPASPPPTPVPDCPMPRCWRPAAEAYEYDLYHPWPLSVEAAVDPRSCEQAAFALGPQISNSEGATVSIRKAS